MKNPIQPLKKDSHGVMRFKSNAIVEHLLEVAQKNGCGLNELADMVFTKDDRQQLAQLIGYSLSGYSELGYVDDDAYGAATQMALNGNGADQARIAHLQSELKALRASLRKPMARLFGIHPDDLNNNL